MYIKSQKCTPIGNLPSYFFYYSRNIVLSAISSFSLFEWGGVFLFLSYRFDFPVFLCWYVREYGFGLLLAIFGGLVYPFFFRKGNPHGFFLPSEGQSLRSIHKISLFWQNDVETIDFSIKMKVGKSGFQNFFRYRGVDENWKI